MSDALCQCRDSLRRYGVGGALRRRRIPYSDGTYSCQHTPPPNLSIAILHNISVQPAAIYAINADNIHLIQKTHPLAKYSSGRL